MRDYKELAFYKNGNYSVKIYEDGTKIRVTSDDEFISAFPESIDLKITNNCDINCKMCHETSFYGGNHANLNHSILDSLKPGMELAIGGGNPLSHPDLLVFLQKMKQKGIICNLTINQKHFSTYKEFLENLVSKKLVYGIGISVNEDYDIDNIIEFSKSNANVVLHIIAGIIDIKLLEKLYDLNLKILILGYKKIGRGSLFYNQNIEENISYLSSLIQTIYSHFAIVSFDNLAIEQLELRSKISNRIYQKHYMGDEGQFTMYIDLVKEEYAVSSTSFERFKIKSDINDIFKHIKDISTNTSLRKEENKC